MRENSIRARSRRKFKVTTDSDHSLPVSANGLDRNFTTDQPNRVWTGDITYIATDVTLPSRNTGHNEGSLWKGGWRWRK